MKTQFVFTRIEILESRQFLPPYVHLKGIYARTGAGFENRTHSDVLYSKVMMGLFFARDMCMRVLVLWNFPAVQIHTKRIDIKMFSTLSYTFTIDFMISW